MDAPVDSNEIAKTIRKIFPHATILTHAPFSKGLVSQTYKVKITNPSKIIVVKYGKLKHKQHIHKNNLILNYLNTHNISAPKVLYERIIRQRFVTIMEYVSGKVASEMYFSANHSLRKKILWNAGKDLRRIHALKIPPFWAHQRHEIRNTKEWKQWTKLRINKYLVFFQRKWPAYEEFLRSELSIFWNTLKNEQIDFVPLHWDYHLANMNVNSQGDITGIFDFDNAMKGHGLADLGQSKYWLCVEQNDDKHFKDMLNGYHKKFTKKDLIMIRGYFLLHLLAVSRSIWFKKKRLGWLLRKHKKILDRYIGEKTGRT